MSDVELTKAQERVLRIAEAACRYEAAGAHIATCERLRERGLMRKTTFRVFKVTAAGRRWIHAADQRNCA